MMDARQADPWTRQDVLSLLQLICMLLLPLMHVLCTRTILFRTRRRRRQEGQFLQPSISLCTPTERSISQLPLFTESPIQSQLFDNYRLQRNVSQS